MKVFNEFVVKLKKSTVIFSFLKHLLLAVFAELLSELMPQSLSEL
jgi:hypothetical protein